jgi:hypothetical protein
MPGRSDPTAIAEFPGFWLELSQDLINAKEVVVYDMTHPSRTTRYYPSTPPHPGGVRLGTSGGVHFGHPGSEIPAVLAPFEQAKLCHNF